VYSKSPSLDMYPIYWLSIKRGTYQTWRSKSI